MIIVFMPIFVISVLLAVAKVSQWINILVLVVLLFVLFFLFMYLCSKLDKKKEQRLKKKKDPFSD